MERTKQNFSPKTPALDHQIEAIEFIAHHTITALFDEQGLGKTKIVIDALCKALESSEIKGALVVSPLSLVYTWEQEVLKHSNLLPLVIRGSERERKYKLLTGANFYIINYEAVVAKVASIKRFCRSRKIAIVLDESARIKNPETKTAKVLFEIAPLATKRIIVTGTPVANKPIDIWSQYYFLDHGKLLGPDPLQFQNDYDENAPDYIEKLTSLRHIISENSIRRTKKAVLELPEKLYRNIFVEIQGRQLELYNTLRDELRIEVSDLDGNRIVDEAENILKRLLRLVQLASNPILIDKEYSETPAKFPVIDELIKQIVSEDNKVIVWTCFIDNILLLKNRLRSYKPLLIYGDVPISERALIVTRFQEEEKHKVLIANPSAAREGLTLTRANHAIYMDRNFSLLDYLQSQDRIHRITQTRKCIVSKIIARNTIDEYVDRIIEFKTDIAKFVQGDTKRIQPESIDTILNKQSLLNSLGG